jgi:hypothetical protein
MSVLIAEVDWGIMRRGFLGLGEMSDDDQNSVMLFVILALSLECVLEALLQGSPERFWVFHGVAVGISAWALSSGSQLGMRFAAIAGVATQDDWETICTECGVPKASIFKPEIRSES